MSVHYQLAYTVEAATKIEAIEKAVGMLRSELRLRGVGTVTQVQSQTAGVPDRWTVCLSVEDLAA